MTDQPDPAPAPAQAPTRSTRRALLTAAAAAAATATLGALTPESVSATTGTMSYGATNNQGSSTTTLAGASAAHLLNLFQDGPNGGGLYISVASGFTGAKIEMAPTVSNNSAGLWATNGDAGTGVGVAGTSYGGSGVYGYSGPDANLYSLMTTARANTAVLAYAPSGTGVYARSDTGDALRVNGRAVFSRAKRITMSAGTSSKTVTLAGVTSSSIILATLQSKRTGYYVSSVVAGSGTFTIYVNKALGSTTAVAYFVLN